MKSYQELIQIPSFKERLEYLRTAQMVGEPTFGSKRYLNQLLYRTNEWKMLRNRIIIRDNACDLAHGDYTLGDQRAYIHHINPITIEDLLEQRPVIFDPENLITCSFNTHQAIHYGRKDSIDEPVERRPNDTCPWKT